MTILAATDFSDASRTAVATAARLARSRGTSLTVAHFVEEAESPPWGSQYEMPDDVGETFREEASRRLDEFWNETLPQGDRPEVTDLRVELVRPDDGVPETAREEGFDLVVIGATGRNRVADFLLGSTAEEIVRGSDVPVLVVPDDGERDAYDRIVAPVDFSDCSRRSLQAAAAFAREENAALEIVHAYIPPTADVSSLSPMVGPDRIEEIEAQRRQQFEAFVDDFDLDDLAVETRLSTGAPHRAITEAVDESGADLVVMGTHGRRGFEKFFLGSTASKILRRMPCAVMTVRTKEDET